MNPNPDVLPLPDQASGASEAPASNNLEALGFAHRGNGKIARLSKAVRDQINNWLLDGLSYPEIIQRLGDQGKDLNPRHFSEYKKRGYEDWLRQREWFEHVTSKAEFSKELLTTPDTTRLHEAGLRMAAAQMLDQLMRFNACVDTENAETKPEQFARLVNALSRLTREALALQKYQDACAQARRAMEPMKDPHRKLTDDERRAIVRKVDEILGLHLEPSERYRFDPRPRTPDGRLLTDLSPEERKRYTDDGKVKTEYLTEVNEGNEGLKREDGGPLTVES